MEDRNQEFKSDRADVRRDGGDRCERVQRHASSEVARKLAAYVRERLRAQSRSERDPIVADLIGGGADNGECTGPSKGRRGEVRRRWVQTAEKLESTLKEFQGRGGPVLCDHVSELQR